MSVHKDHRARLRARYMEQGIFSLSEHEVLELLLFYCIPRRDTNTLAHELVDRFGSLPKVMDAPCRELEKVDGVGENASLFLSFVRDVGLYCAVRRTELETTILNSLEECARYLAVRLKDKPRETVYLLCLDAKCKVLSCRQVEEGNVNSAAISIRKIVDMALTENATSVVLAHNHPSGMTTPSPEDIQTTKRLAYALKYVDVVLNDHVVVAESGYLSMALSGLYSVNDIYGR